ncbi:hypothetical protein Namu_4944 [Nakamurella multipartita DSM 44233]|uniref:Uncharacterized protein n=1 Tax=Nakamurella multipartita (strain ATCC 700099 / DSM 44233 / CIP 104796 / JCM 9543 / NBRC 105858 / Y-104) TaxID=479431 RepID=C8XA17_NAKMY|nr:hypothetical protein Namu_4944 [Nakamurella multipartita DSM 44233]
MLAGLAKASLKGKREQLTMAMTGRFTGHHGACQMVCVGTAIGC